MIVCATLLIMPLVRKRYVQKIEQVLFISTVNPHVCVLNIHNLATKFPLSGMRNFPYTEISLLRCRVCRKRRCRRCGVRGGLLRFRRVFRRLCLCGSRCGRGLRRLTGGEDEVVVVLAVEEWHEALFAGKTLVDE